MVRANSTLDAKVTWDPIVVRTLTAEFQFLPRRQYLVSQSREGLKIDTFLHLKPETGKLVVLGQDAVKRKTTILPLFHRWSWYNEIDASVVVLNDPTLYEHPALDGGWSQGKQRTFAPEVIATVIQDFCAMLQVAPENAVIFGTSAGGFGALMLGAELGSLEVVVDIPQVDLFSYHDLPVRNAMLEACYPGMNMNELLTRFGDRLRVLDRFAKLYRAPRSITYCQNMQDVRHIRTQMNPFLEELENLRERGLPWLPDVSVKFYDRLGEGGRGHIQMEKDSTISVINDVLQRIPISTDCSAESRAVIDNK